MDKGQSFKERLLFRKRRRYENRQVLRDISFTVKRGEAVGLIGHNGCGKSTTLKLLTRILYPDSGTITIQGRVSSLIELGAGFHPDMSGRENIYTNASIFGLSKKEIDARLQTIIDFSELEPFIDNPVRTYSSGMYMRLAFSVAINVDADVLLIDEILGVGDVNFQAKCFQKLQEIKADGTTIVIVSHSMGQIEQICDRCIWIEDGLIKEEGIPKYVDEHYLSEMEQLRLAREEAAPERTSGKRRPTRNRNRKASQRMLPTRRHSPGRNSRRSAKNPQCAWGRTGTVHGCCPVGGRRHGTVCVPHRRRDYPAAEVSLRRTGENAQGQLWLRHFPGGQRPLLRHQCGDRIRFLGGAAKRTARSRCGSETICCRDGISWMLQFMHRMAPTMMTSAASRRLQSRQNTGTSAYAAWNPAGS